MGWAGSGMSNRLSNRRLNRATAVVLLGGARQQGQKQGGLQWKTTSADSVKVGISASKNSPLSSRIW